MLGGAIAIGLVHLFLPLVLAMLAHRRWRTPWSLFGAGAFAFVLSKVVQIPLSSALDHALGPDALPPGLRLAIFLAFAPLCEESARFLALRSEAERMDAGRGHRDALFFGLGHGGTELMILSGLSVLNLGASVSGMLSPEAEHAIARATDGPWWILLAGPLERAVALVCHLAMSWLVWRAVRENTPRWLLASMGLHYAFNAAVVGTAATFGPAASMAATLLVSPLPIGLVLLARRLDPISPRTSPASPDRSMAISCRGLGKSFEDTMAVGALDLDVARGELFALLGPNGAGKTTLVRMLAGLVPPSRGRASVMGHELGDDDDAIRQSIGVLTEAPGLYESLSAEVNLRLFGRLSGLEGRPLDERIESLLRRFELWERRHDAVGSFSKGMRQKVSIARVLVTNPPLLFLDEPTSGLDPSAAEEVHALVRALKAEGHTIVLTTHRLREAEELADRVGILKTDMLALDTVAALRKRLYGQRVRLRCLAEPGHTPEQLLTTAREIATAIDGIASVEVAPAREGVVELVVQLSDPDEQVPTLVRSLVDAGLPVRSIADVEESLEDVYLDVLEKSR
ncbi:MAG: ATP-binding cassette domain-containing protein [Sandaracinaceae bacterium]|nr:ATP-binding cassette domain-containing protein [Sandaracinaceae bacterium]